MLSKPRLVVISGSGTSVEAGIPTYRGAEGKWNQFDIEQVCRMETIDQYPVEIAQFYNAFRMQVQSAQPTAFHKKLLSASRFADIQILTQNVDDLYEKAGFQHVFHVHGDIRYMRCRNAFCRHKWSVGYEAQVEHAVCSRCLYPAKTDVIFFNESASVQYMTVEHVLRQLDEEDVVLVVGTQGNVLDVQGMLDLSCARKYLINMEPSDYLDEEAFDGIFYGPCTVAIDYVFHLLGWTVK